MPKLIQVLGSHAGETIPTPSDLKPSSSGINTTLNNASEPSSSSDRNTSQSSQAGDESYPTTALGGTFDHLHAAHKLLLHLSLFLTTKRLIVGLMTPSLLQSKSNAQLLEPLDDRIRNVHHFLSRQNDNKNTSRGVGVELDVVEIHDPFGPTAWDGDIQALVVSRETLSGGEAVNKKRKEKGLGELDVWVIDVIAAAAAAEPNGEGSGVEGNGGDAGIKTRDLSHVDDEGELKVLKMGSTAIRQWIKDHPEA